MVAREIVAQAFGDLLQGNGQGALESRSRQEGGLLQWSRGWAEAWAFTQMDVRGRLPKLPN